MRRRVAAVVPDLFFSTRIAATAEAAGVAFEALTAEAAPARLASGEIALLILDLAAAGAIEMAAALKADEATRGIPIVGFYSHVEQATRERALAAGIDHVMPRSAFTARLPALLAGE